MRRAVVEALQSTLVLRKAKSAVSESLSATEGAKRTRGLKQGSNGRGGGDEPLATPNVEAIRALLEDLGWARSCATRGSSEASINDELEAIARERHQPLVREREQRGDKADGVLLPPTPSGAPLRFLFDSADPRGNAKPFRGHFERLGEDLLDAIAHVESPNRSAGGAAAPSGAAGGAGSSLWGVVKLQLHTEPVRKLRETFRELHPSKRQRGRRVALGPFPESRRRSRGRRAGLLRGREAYYARLKAHVDKIELVTDELFQMDVQHVADNDYYFPFEEALGNVVLAFSRDPWVLHNSAVRCARAPRGEAQGADGRARVEGRLAVPPCAVQPFRGFVSYTAPLTFVYEREEPIYYCLRAMYAKFWCKLNIGVDPLAVALPWIQFGFVGLLDVDQVLLLWDRILGFEDLSLLPILAAAIFVYRSAFRDVARRRWQRDPKHTSPSTRTRAMSNAVRDAMEAQLRRDATLGASVDALFRCVPAHLVPVDEQMSKAQVIVDRPSFRALAARLLGRPAPAGAADDAFDGLDVDGVGVLSVAEIAIGSAAAAPGGVGDAAVADARRRLQAKLGSLVARDGALVSGVALRLEKLGFRALDAAEFHRLALRALHLPLARDVSDALFSSIAGGEPVVTVAAFVAAAMPKDYARAPWYVARRDEMTKTAAERRDPASASNDHVPKPPASRRDPAKLREAVGHHVAKLAASDDRALTTVVRVFATADPKGRVSHLEGGGQRRISRDEFRHVLARILMIPCGADDADAVFATYAKADGANLTLEEFVHQSMPPDYSREQWNVAREQAMRRGHGWTDDAAGASHKRHGPYGAPPPAAKGREPGGQADGAPRRRVGGAGARGRRRALRDAAVDVVVGLVVASSRPATNRPSKYQRTNTVHARAVLKTPVFVQRKCLRATDLPKHRLAQALLAAEVAAATGVVALSP
ncbi:hypothetical protein JL721_5752 [Aureococcus anophagefferens]|nr:hypothetical protein JL721_5752 [Aureococcus anophagefferens]